MRLFSALAVACVISGFGAARADDYRLLQGCVESSNAACLEAVGVRLAGAIDNPRDKALMMARFGLIDWASGNKVQGDTRLLQAWSHLSEIPNEGCLPRVDATLALEDLTALFGNELASRLVLRNLVREAAAWPKNAPWKCSRPANAEHWLSHVAQRQQALADKDGLKASLDLAFAWGMDSKMSAVDYATRPGEAAAALGRHGRAGDAVRVCDANRAAIVAKLASDAAPPKRAEAHWRALECYRAAGVKDASRTAYQEFARLRLDAVGLADGKSAPAQGNEPYGPLIWDLVQQMSWRDPVLASAPKETALRPARACFERPSAQCLTYYAMSFVNAQKRGAAKRFGYSPAVDFSDAGALDGFARFLIGAGGDLVGDQARQWFLTQAKQSPLENLRGVVADAVRADDLIWARRVFYTWYTSGGETYFHRLTDPDAIDDSVVSQETWPLHVAWSIALIVNDLHPAFEPEELADFAETAWDDGIAQLPSLREIPPTELIDADERSGEHLLDLCFRDAFGEWAAKLFAHAHMPERAREARGVLPEAARDCAFARRSIGPILRTADWFAAQGETAPTRELLLEGADRLTRPHYHVYSDSDPALGGAALAAMALGLKRGILVPPPYESVF